VVGRAVSSHYMEPIRVLVADDHLVMRRGIRAVVECMEGWSVCGEAATGREAVEMAERLHPDVVVMDVQMPDLNGLEATRQIRKAAPEIEVLMFTGLETEDLVRQVFAAGARSYIVKTDGKDELGAALRSVAAHTPYFTTKVGEILFAKSLTGNNNNDVAGEEVLTPRERETVQLLTEGSANKDVAAKLGISVKTVETHRATIMRKLQLEAFSELVRYAVRNHMIAA